jgi:hypothetical protein
VWCVCWRVVFCHATLYAQFRFQYSAPHMRKITVCYMAHDDHWFLAEWIKSYAPAGPVFVFVSDQPWNGEPGELEKTEDIVKPAGAKVVKASGSLKKSSARHLRTAI